MPNKYELVLGVGDTKKILQRLFIRTALEQYNADLRSQQREEAKYLRLEDLFRKLVGSERRY
jgi:hypothetical protein